MQTTKYEKKIKDYILNLTFTNRYSFFSNYEEACGRPKFSLIFLKYKDFDYVIEYFFNELIDFLRASGNYNNLIISPIFNGCIREFFIKTYISSGKLSKKVKQQYNALKLLNTNEFNNLVDEIKEIKLYFKAKYINTLYDNIRDDFGIKLQNENEIFLCPYCERNYVNVIHKKDDFIIKPDLDHFYPKSKYPFLAATLENLVPSCQVCNSRLKGEIDFHVYKHSHPLDPSENIFRKIEFNRLGKKNIYIKNKIHLDNKERKYIRTFKIEEVYNSHKEILEDLLEKNKKYNLIKRSHILKSCPSLSIRSLKDLVFHEYININENKTPMSSMKKSLFKKIVK